MEDIHGRPRRRHGWERQRANRASDQSVEKRKYTDRLWDKPGEETREAATATGRTEPTGTDHLRGTTDTLLEREPSGPEYGG